MALGSALWTPSRSLTSSLELLTLGRPMFDSRTALGSTQVGAFFDLYEDGVWDLLVGYPNGTIEAWRQPPGGLDRYFLKVVTSDGACTPAPLDGKLVMPASFELPFGLGQSLGSGGGHVGGAGGAGGAGGSGSSGAGMGGEDALQSEGAADYGSLPPGTLLEDPSALDGSVSGGMLAPPLARSQGVTDRPAASTADDDAAGAGRLALPGVDLLAGMPLRVVDGLFVARADDDVAVARVGDGYGNTSRGGARTRARTLASGAGRCYEATDAVRALGITGYMAGVNQPGVSYQYLTSLPSRWESDSGAYWALTKAKQPHAATQLAQSGYAPLLAPYVLVGLGQTHDYVEELAVGLPAGQVRSFQQAIIPNSRLVVLPYPYDEPSRWELRLYLEPRQQLHVFLALCAALLSLGVLVVILEVRERIQDSREKRALAPALPL